MREDLMMQLQSQEESIPELKIEKLKKENALLKEKIAKCEQKLMENSYMEVDKYHLEKIFKKGEFDDYHLNQLIKPNELNINEIKEKINFIIDAYEFRFGKKEESEDNDGLQINE